MIEGFTVQNWKKRILRMPIEDSFSFDERGNYLAVSDGITRDPSEFLPDLSTLLGKLQFAWKYPRPSPAAYAAQTFTKWAGNSTNIREIFEGANNEIEEINCHLDLGNDYLTQDPAGCVAALALRDGDYFHYGFMTDCGIALFDKHGDLLFRTPNEGPKGLEEYAKKDKRLVGADWTKPETRTTIRRYYRNEPDNAESYGALTGETDAMYYLRTGTVELKPGQHLFVYSDGLEQTILGTEFAHTLIENPKSIKALCQRKVKSEGTLVHFVKKSQIK